ncbi:MAG: GNAT family N-acetyltransferase [Butyricicoccus sp.]
MTTLTMKTERLLLRPIQTDDIKPIFDCWMQDEEVSRYMYWQASHDLQDAAAFVEYEQKQLDNNQWNRWLLILPETDQLIGTCLIFYNEEEGCWDISYNLGKAFWGKGYMTEAMTLVMHYAVQELGMRECIAVHAAENEASGRVIQKLGFQYEKDVPYVCGGGSMETTGKYYRYKAGK